MIITISPQNLQHSENYLKNVKINDNNESQQIQKESLKLKKAF